MITPAAPTNLVGALFVGAAQYKAILKKGGDVATNPFCSSDVKCLARLCGSGE